MCLSNIPETETRGKRKWSKQKVEPPGLALWLSSVALETDSNTSGKPGSERQWPP